MSKVELANRREQQFTLRRCAAVKGLPRRVILRRLAGAELGDVSFVIDDADCAFDGKVEWACIPTKDGWAGQRCVVIPELVIVEANGEEALVQLRQILPLDDAEVETIQSWFEVV